MSVVNDFARNVLQETPVYEKRFRKKRETAYRNWEANGRNGPTPPFVKEKMIRQHAEQFGTKVLVETGTFLGETIYALRNVFDAIYSIELDEKLYNRAVRKFARRKNVKLFRGDSSQNLPGIFEEIPEKSSVLFWLDAHYSGGPTARGDKDTPIMEELDLILTSRKILPVVLIDDLHSFGTDPGYPESKSVLEYAEKKGFSGKLWTGEDIIGITPGEKS